MQSNILRNSNVAKIYLFYIEKNGLKKKVSVKLRYMGAKDCYFAGEIIPNFVKQKRKSPVEIFVYTTDGIYKTSSKILDTTVNLNEIMYQVEIPKKWDFKQLRNGSRKPVTLPGSIKIDEEQIINFETFDLSVGDFSFVTETPISTMAQRFPVLTTIEFPSNLLINFPDRKLVKEAKFVRNAEVFEGEFTHHFYALKFLDLTPDEEMILKNYLLKLN